MRIIATDQNGYITEVELTDDERRATEAFERHLDEGHSIERAANIVAVQGGNALADPRFIDGWLRCTSGFERD